MGCIRSRETRYRPLSSKDGDTHILVEIDKTGTSGRYWFRFELPPALSTASVVSDPPPSAPSNKDHRYHERTKRIIKDAKEQCAEFKTTRYQHWKEMSASNHFSLYRHRIKGDFIATCSVKGILAHELAYEFWNTDEKSKLEWDTSVESCRTIEVLSSACSIVHIITKTIWPVKARDAVICTELVRISEGTYAVCNYSVTDCTSPLISTDGDYCRALSSIVLIVEQHRIDTNKGMDRDNIQSEMFYQADIDPGGWIPESIVNRLSRREWEASLASLCRNTQARINKEARPDLSADDDLFFDSQEQNIVAL
tara:strand:+ start:241 stop:1170 length:930 start_codon:yes stop_codon:yes gene_type:complete